MERRNSVANPASSCRSRRTFVGTALIASAATLLAAIAMARPPQASPKSVKNIVLVHGAFADGSSWSKVIPILQAKGYNVTAVQTRPTTLGSTPASVMRSASSRSG